MSKLLVVLGVLPVAPLAILTDLSAVSSCSLGRHLEIRDDPLLSNPEIG